MKKERARGEEELDTSYGYHLMLDDGTIRQHDIGEYRSKLVMHLAKLEQGNHDSCKYIFRVENF